MSSSFDDFSQQNGNAPPSTLDSTLTETPIFGQDFHMSDASSHHSPVETYQTDHFPSLESNLDTMSIHSDAGHLASHHRVAYSEFHSSDDSCHHYVTLNQYGMVYNENSNYIGKVENRSVYDDNSHFLGYVAIMIGSIYAKIVIE